MNLKNKLIIAFVIIIAIPIVLISAVGGVIINYQLNAIKQSYDVESTTQVLTNPMQLLNRLTRGVYNDIKLCALKTPEKFEETEFIQNLNEDVEEKQSFIVLRKNKDIIYYGNEDKGNKVVKSLPAFGNYTLEMEGGIYVGGNNQFLIKQQDFYFTDGGEGSIFVVTDVNQLLPQVKTSAFQLVYSVIIIICFTAVLLTYWIYTSILRPLNTLKVATNKIKDGDLDFSIETDLNDEIGSLCEDFEEMRVRLKELIEDRMQIEVDMKELISNISHDLKTPITAIKGYSEGILDGVADTPEKLDKYLKTIYTKANDMSSLVDELSFYSKIDCNTMPYTFANINLDRYFSDCIEELSLDLEVKNIDIGYFNYTDKDLKIIADHEQLKRVVNNIIGNSVKYIGKKKGLINVRINDADSFVKVEIEDNGKGIAKADLNNIFARFYRTDASRNSSKGGSGLGLAIAQKIIDDHGGKIWASSKEDVGTIIYFTLKKSEEGMIDLDAVNAQIGHK